MDGIINPSHNQRNKKPPQQNSGSTDKLFAYSGLSSDTIGGAPGYLGGADPERISSGGYYGGGGGGGTTAGRPRGATETGSMLEGSSMHSLRPGRGDAAGGNGGGGCIVDVIVVHGSDGVPAGYSKLERSSGGRRADLNTGARGQYLYLAVSFELRLVSAVAVVVSWDGGLTVASQVGDVGSTSEYVQSSFAFLALSRMWT